MGLGLATALAKVFLPPFPAGMQEARADTQFGWRHRGEHFRGGIWEGLQARAAEGRDGASDEKADAESVKRKAENKEIRRDVWMRA
jgi:hypothetical protein